MRDEPMALCERKVISPIARRSIDLLANVETFFVADQRAFRVAEIVLEVISLNRAYTLVSRGKFAL